MTGAQLKNVTAGFVMPFPLCVLKANADCGAGWMAVGISEKWSLYGFLRGLCGWAEPLLIFKRLVNKTILLFLNLLVCVCNMLPIWCENQFTQCLVVSCCCSTISELGQVLATEFCFHLHNCKSHKLVGKHTFFSLSLKESSFLMSHLKIYGKYPNDFRGNWMGPLWCSENKIL